VGEAKARDARKSRARPSLDPLHEQLQYSRRVKRFIELASAVGEARALRSLVGKLISALD